MKAVGNQSQIFDPEDGGSVPLKRQLTFNRLQGVISQKIELFRSLQICSLQISFCIVTDFDFVPDPVFSFKTQVCHHSPAGGTTAATLIRVGMHRGALLKVHCYSCVFPPRNFPCPSCFYS
jgi:hypothetical protein